MSPWPAVGSGYDSGVETPPSIWNGGLEPPPERIALRAGPLSMLFEPESGFLRHVRLGGREVLRGIYGAVRDQNWCTVPPGISNLRLERDGGGFRMTFDVACREGPIDFGWRGTLSGTGEGTITYSMDGSARSSFLRNRIGLCVLHPGRPGECAGEACTVEKTGGALEHGALPLRITPDRPFLDIKAITHHLGGGTWAEVRFEGDVFEMEDQRNWTDATFKTYSTPLEIPFPVEVKAGDRVRQSVTLTLRGRPPESAGSRDRDAIVLTVGGPAGAMPRIGLGTASHGAPLSAREVERLRRLSLSHIRAELDLAGPAWQSALARAAGEARSVGAAIEAAVFVSGAADAGLGLLAKEIERLGAPIGSFLVFSAAEKCTPADLVRLARARLAPAAPGALLGGGTDAYFAELNRDCPPGELLDLVSYSINPQVHMSDNASLVENLEAQAWTVENARKLAGGRPVAVSPVTLKPRFNPDATSPPCAPCEGDLPPEVDPRQMSLFGAAWTLGSLSSLAGAGAASVTIYETTGWRGVMETEGGSPLPGKFPSIAGAVFPLYHVLADFGDFAGGELLECSIGDPLAVAGAVFRKDGRTRVLLANLTMVEREARVDLSSMASTGPATIQLLDAANAESAMTDPEAHRASPGREQALEGGCLRLRLTPYAVARIDL